MGERQGVIEEAIAEGRRAIALDPKERLRILRKALKATLKDPEFLAQAKRSKLIINYVSGEEIEKFVDQTLAISPETKESLQFLLVVKR